MIKTYNRVIDDGHKTFIIAEAGVNHNGDINLAKKLIDAAVDAGADAVKFQTFKAEKIVIKKAEKAEYQKITTNNDESQFHMLKKLELSYEDHVQLYNYCRKKNIMFLSTPFDMDSVDLLEKIGIEVYKISSGDITNMPLLKYIASKNKPIILSTGMSNLGEIEEAIEWIKGAGNEKIILLHCTTNYPTEYKDVNLRAMNTMKEAFKLPVGYSDHTLGIEVPIAAVAMGACVIEKHFTLDKQMKGPDHKASLEPKELKKMVRTIRNIEICLGNGIKKCIENELENRLIGRKSIVAAHDIKKGEVLKLESIDFKRPGSGIEPKYYMNLIEKKITRDIKEDEIIRWNDIYE
ncbi:N-acetylneuraminate synthase [Crassaminicella thermophila]|uniref:N-acetylneuraminate synthase n=1 Tax=Crassaminicella thermophila TaxID=2599308 RepID=A0A5C0SDJ4_CRATE|nr:N-acetylneuraminate synthase [Crassaminicella thermophila]QEK11314.1 N-acetylneuraminate synthase [Crassaminicella thermophila]